MAPLLLLLLLLLLLMVTVLLVLLLLLLRQLLWLNICGSHRSLLLQVLKLMNI
jgi:hypothetical protein